MTNGGTLMRSLTAGILLAAGLSLASSGGAHAAQLDFVTNCLSGQPGSFDEVATHAASGDTIQFSVDCTGPNTISISPSLAPISVSGTLIIDGTGHHVAITSSNSAFHVQSTGNLSLNNLTLSGVHGYYGAIENQGNLLVAHSTFAGGSGNWSAGITNMAFLSVTGSTFTGGNGNLSGAISAFGSQTIITNSTFTGNTAALGAAILETNFVGISPNATILNSTFSGNDSTESATLIVAGALTIANTILANPTVGTNCYLANGITDDDHNLEDDSARNCGFGGAGLHDLVGVNPQLGPLADNGGPTETLALAATSPAIDAGGCGITPDRLLLPDVDQRGVSRPQMNGCDIGAFEYHPAAYTLTVALALPAPYTAYTSAHIANGTTTLGPASPATPLAASIPFGTTIDLSATPAILATTGALTTYFFTGFSPALPAQLHADTSTTAHYTSIEDVLVTNRSAIGALAYSRLNGLWLVAEHTIAQPYASTATRTASIKAFACQVKSLQTAGTVSTQLGTQLTTFASEAYTAAGGTLSGPIC